MDSSYKAMSKPATSGAGMPVTNSEQIELDHAIGFSGKI